MKRIAALHLVLLSSLVCTGCAGSLPPPGYSGPGCYDHKGRIEPTIRSPGECAAATWVWRTAP